MLAFFIVPRFFPYALFIAVIVLFKHAGNIKRLMRGEEPKLSFKSKGKSEKDEKTDSAAESDNVAEPNVSKGKSEDMEKPKLDESTQKGAGKEKKKHEEDEFDF